MEQNNPVRVSEKTPPLEIGTAWLLLSHGAWLGVSIGSLGISVFADNVALSHGEKRGKSFRPFAIACAALSVTVTAWTVFAIITTWISNMRVKNAVFGHTGFITVLLLALFVLALASWTVSVLSS
jgi:hypothetical protein